MSDKKCKTCLFLHDDFLPGTIQKAAICRRFPPVTFIHNSQMIAMQPPVMPENWCGEYQDAKKPGLTVVS